MNDPRAYQEFEYKNELRSEMATAKNSETRTEKSYYSSRQQKIPNKAKKSKFQLDQQGNAGMISHNKGNIKSIQLRLCF
jgi:hypothetical protein